MTDDEKRAYQAEVRRLRAVKEGTDNDSAPRRVTVSQLAMAMAERRTVGKPQTDVTITRNAKGDWQVSIAVTGEDADETFATANRLADEFDRLYPYEPADA